MYFLIVVLRMVTIIRGGDPYHNRLLEIVNYLYGVNTMLLVLRFSSILELSSRIGPLQIALFQMLIDLMIILFQFFFVITAFSVAITKIYVAEMSYLTPTYNQTESTMAQYDVWVFFYACPQTKNVKCYYYIGIWFFLEFLEFLFIVSIVVNYIVISCNSALEAAVWILINLFPTYT